MRHCGLVGLVLLAACSTAGPWQKPGADEAAQARDAENCRVQANRALATDRSIDEDILSTRSGDWQRAGTLEPQRQQMREHAATDTAAVFGSCMRAKGYTRQQKPG